MAKDETKPKKKKGGGIISRIVIAIVCLAIGFGGGVFASIYLVASDVDPVSDGDKEININVIESEIKEISELATYQYWYRNINTYQERNKQIFNLVDIPLTSNFLAVRYEGVVKIGSDLSDMDIEVNGNNIDISLPHAKILSHTIDHDSWHKIYEDSTIFNPIKVEDGNQLEKDGIETIETYLNKKGAIEEADKKVESQITSMIKIIYPDANVSVIFK